MITWLAFLLGFWIGVVLVRAAQFSDVPVYGVFALTMLTFGTAAGLLLVGLAVVL